MKISFIKNLIPLNLFFWLKYRNEFKNSKSINSSSSKRIYYLDSPEYGNLGDQAIALAIREFAKKQFPSYEFIEILQKDLPFYIGSLKKNIRNDDLIFLTGGGNMGNLYRTYEAARRFVIKKFPNIHIVVFPQIHQMTVYPDRCIFLNKLHKLCLLGQFILIISHAV